MALGHEKLDVYRLATSYVARVYEKAARLERACFARRAAIQTKLALLFFESATGSHKGVRAVSASFLGHG